MSVPPAAFGLLCLALQEPPLDEDSLEPGALAVYRSLGSDASLTRIEPKPACALGHSSPHSRIPPGPFEATWTGALVLDEGDSLRFGAYVGGTLEMWLDSDLVPP
jgi:hypothetical protein